MSRGPVWLGLLLGLLICRSAAAQPEGSLIAALDRYIPELLERDDVPGVAVALVEKGEVVWSKGYGVADTRTGAPVTPQHVFAHGSNCKPVTAWGAMKLVERGLVELDAPVDRYLKRWHLPTSGPGPSGVTLRRLLSHTAGLAREPVTFNHPRRPSPSLERIFSGEVPFGEPVRLLQEPGAGYAYSNAGYALVQLLIEDVTGEPFSDYMQREVLDPLGMRRSHFGWTPELQAAAPQPYGAHGEPLPFLRVIEASAGGFMGPVPEYARFLAAAMPGPHGEPPGRGVLKPETVSLMLAPQPGTDGQAGLGYRLGSIVEGPHIISHQGYYPGWWAGFMAVPERGRGIVVASPSERARALINNVLVLWALSVEGEPLPPAPPFEPYTPSRLSSWAQWTLGVALVLGLGALAMAGLLLAQVLRGRRRWTRGRSVRTVLLLGLSLLVALGWLLVAHGPVPLSTTPFDMYPWESSRLTAAVLLWACVGVAAAFLPKRAPSGPSSERPSAPQH